MPRMTKSARIAGRARREAEAAVADAANVSISTSHALAELSRFTKVLFHRRRTST